MPQTITNIPRCLPKILTVPQFWYHLAHSFSRKKVPFDFEKMKLKKWHQNSWHWQKSAQSSEIFVTSRGISQSVGVSSRKGEHFPIWTKMVRTKIKPGLWQAALMKGHVVLKLSSEEKGVVELHYLVFYLSWEITVFCWSLIEFNDVPMSATHARITFHAIHSFKILLRRKKNSKMCESL